MRLTKLKDDGNYTTETKVTKQDCLNKLGRIEDFDEGTGYGLDTITQALMYGIYAKDENGRVWYIPDVQVAFDNIENKWSLYSDSEFGYQQTFKSEDFKVKWSIDKEDLIEKMP